MCLSSARSIKLSKSIVVYAEETTKLEVLFFVFEMEVWYCPRIVDRAGHYLVFKWVFVESKNVEDLCLASVYAIQYHAYEMMTIWMYDMRRPKGEVTFEIR